MSDETIKTIDDIITDKGIFVMSKKSVKVIVGVLITCTLFILGLAWGFNVNLESKIDSNHKTVMIKIDELQKEEIKPNTIKIYELDGNVKVLLDRTNSKNTIINVSNNIPVELLNQTDTLPTFAVN